MNIFAAQSADDDALLELELELDEVCVDSTFPE
jgi:hypothetical protein